MTKFGLIHTNSISQNIVSSMHSHFHCFSLCFILVNSTPQILNMNHWIISWSSKLWFLNVSPGTWCTHDNFRRSTRSTFFLNNAKTHLPYSLSLSDECTEEFSRRYMIWWCHTLAENESYACIFFGLNVFLSFDL